MKRFEGIPAGRTGSLNHSRRVTIQQVKHPQVHHVDSPSREHVMMEVPVQHVLVSVPEIGRARQLLAVVSPGRSVMADTVSGL